MRADLLALSADDLAAFSNRGLTRRGEQEANNANFTCRIAETSAGDVHFAWSDGVTCDLGAGARISEFRCSCSSTTICRHILRSVFAYQKQQKDAGPIAENSPAETSAGSNQESIPTSTTTPVSPNAPNLPSFPVPWNPGEISNKELNRFYSTAELARLEREFASGHVLQLAVSAKPRAQLHTLGCTVNFLVPHDIRYAACDCAKDAPCSHVALAVWAFRKLAPGQTHGLVSTASSQPSVPVDLLDTIEREILSLAELSLARTSSINVDQWRRLSERALAATLIWPADLLSEIAELHAAYLSGDARFDPREWLALVAELIQRLDVIRTGRSDVPSLFVRGSMHNRETDIGSARMIGLGCGVRVYRGGTQLTAFLQDSDSGSRVAVIRRYPDPEPTAGPPKLFSELSTAYALKGASMAALGRGQLLIKGGRRTPSGQFLPGRAPVSVSPQSYQWETLRAPLRVSGFEELREQLKSAPPAALGPRQTGTHLSVCPVIKASEVDFISATQEVVAKLHDANGQTGWLVHPYRSRSAAGSEKLLRTLRSHPDRIRFTCGEARVAGAELIIYPVSVIFDDGAGVRRCIQPWVDPADTRLGTGEQQAVDAAPVVGDALHDYLEELQSLLAETWLTGARVNASSWTRIQNLGMSLGFTQLAEFSGIERPDRLMQVTALIDFAYREFYRLDGV